MIASHQIPRDVLSRLLACSAIVVISSQSLAAQTENIITRPVHRDALDASVHEGLDCDMCHDEAGGQAGDPVGSAKVGRVNCSGCHEEAAEVYQKHGRLIVGSDADMPRCQDCHGSHDILPSSNAKSHTHPAAVPGTCRACHTDVDVVRRHQPLNGKAIELYELSVHGDGRHGDDREVARCNDCHAANGPDGTPTTHRILSPCEPESPTHHFNISQTCGRCHEDVATGFWEGVHGELVNLGSMDAPACIDCHGEHGIISPDDPRSPVSAARLAEQTCGRCHASTAMNERLGTPPGIVRNYVDTYHGLKRQAGNVHVANCSSCHGNHRILRHTDPRSRVNPTNLQKTCGECHPGISKVMASSSIHTPERGDTNWWPSFFKTLYLWMIAITIGAMLLHNLLHWFRHVRDASRAPSVVRLSRGETAQHWLLMVSFIVLVVSGFSLRHSEAWWVTVLFGWGGGEGFVVRGTIHRIAGVFLMGWTVWHAIYLLTRRGRLWFFDMLPLWSDVQGVWGSLAYFVGIRAQPPSAKRFSYVEKAEYWALLWGTVLMTITGLMLWFDNEIAGAQVIGNGREVLLKVASVIHYYEAWLATLAILVWHIYATVFSPTVYPMNPAWWSGRMPLSMHDDEHPDEASDPSDQQGE